MTARAIGSVMAGGLRGGRALRLGNAKAAGPRAFVEACRQAVREMGVVPMAERPDVSTCAACDSAGWVLNEAGRDVLCGPCDGYGYLRERSLVDGVACEVCRGVGFVRDASRKPGTLGFGSAERCPACIGSPSTRRRTVRAAGLPRGYEGFTLAGYANSAALEMTQARFRAAALAHDLVESPGDFSDDHEGSMGLFLYGPPGRTKSGLAAAVLNELAPRVASAAWVAWPYLLDEIRATYNATSPINRRAVLERYGQASLLVLDDFSRRGAGKEGDEWRTEQAWMLLEERCRFSGLVTVVTSNLTPEGVEAEFDGQVLSRLRKLCVFHELDGRDERGRPARAVA